MKTVLITGAGGAIGVHMVAHIMHNTDWNIVATDSFKDEHKGYFDRLVTVCRDHPEWPQRIKIITHDLNAPFTDREVRQMGEINYIINLASRSDVHNSISEPGSFVRNNTELMLTMMDLAVKLGPTPGGAYKEPRAGLEAFLHFSTDEVYGPTPKDSGGHPEWDAIVPSNPYAASKACQEAIAIAWWRSFNVPLIITNTMNNFGEMQAPSKFPAMVQKKIAAGETIDIHAASSGEVGTRYYIHSRNTADAVLFILKNVQPILHTYGEIDRPVRLNIVGDKQVDNAELVDIIAGLMEMEAKGRLVNYHENNPGHDIHYGLNGEKLAALGWQSPVPFEESLKHTIQWQKDNPEWLR